MNNILIANIVGVFAFPLTIWQFGFSRSKGEFLMINLSSSSIWAISFFFTGQNTAAVVSLVAGLSSFSQFILSKFKDYIRFYAGFLVFILSIFSAIYISTPVDLWDWLPVLVFCYVRFIEILKENIMRILIIASPIAWIIIAFHGENYSLIPNDVVGLMFGFFWIFNYLVCFNREDVKNVEI